MESILKCVQNASKMRYPILQIQNISSQKSGMIPDGGIGIWRERVLVAGSDSRYWEENLE